MTQELVAILRFDTGTVYRVKGWLSSSDYKRGPFKNPAELSRLGPDGWHTLEPFKSNNGNGSRGRKTREELIEIATEIIENVYEPDATLEHTREFPYLDNH